MARELLIQKENLHHNKMVQTKDELYQGIRNKTDELKLEFIESEIKKGMPTETKIVALQIMAEIYQNKRWHNLAAKNYCNAADLAPTFHEKVDLYFNAGLLFLKAGNYFSADDNFRKVLVLASKTDREKFQEKINNFYVEQASEYEKAKYYTKAIKAFSRVITLKLPVEQLSEAYDKLSVLYEKIGKPHEAIQIRDQKEAMIKAKTEEKETEEKESEEETKKTESREYFYDV